MTWLVTIKPSYQTDFIELPKDLQKQVAQAIHDISADPVTSRGNTIKPLKGYDNVWRYRMGDHRLIYAAAHDQAVVQLLAIGPRGSVYERFNYDGWELPESNLTFDTDLQAALNPQKTKAPEWERHPEWFQPPVGTDKAGEPLPRKLTPAQLKKWLIPEAYHSALMRCRTEEELLAADLPDEVLGRVMDALWPPDAGRLSQQPDYVLSDPADLEAYADGTLRAFLLHLDDSQRRFASWALEGPTLVKGGPGSGKSTVALYRVRDIVAHALQNGGDLPEILFTTYTNPLIDFSESLLKQLLGDLLPTGRREQLPRSLRISTLDKTVTWIVRQSGLVFKLAYEEQRLEALQAARRAFMPKEIGDLDKLKVTSAVGPLRDDYLLEEFEWVIEGQDCRSEDHYLAANRVGRGVPFNQGVRAAVWQIYTKSRESLLEQECYTWGMLRQLALDIVKAGQFTRRWDAVIVDEAQDLTPTALSLCLELCRDPKGVFLTADANQSLYNRGFRWQNVHDHLKVKGRTRILRRNYRSTREIMAAAGELLTAADGRDAEALQQEFLHTGEPPLLYPAYGAADQAGWVAQQIVRAARELRLPLNAAGVLCPSNSLAMSFADLLTEQGLKARYMASQKVNLDERCVKVMTLHAAKGLEFPITAVVHVEADRLPKIPDTEDEQDLQEHIDAQRRLFFVGCTRAMRYLFVTYDGSIPSRFLQLCSDDNWLRVS